MAIKSLLPGIVALMVAGGAQAADLPLAPEPVDYVRVCDTYGTGFFYIPGTETCLRVAGRVRAEYRLFDLDQRGSRGRDADRSRFRVRGYLRMESRTETEFGLLRTYLDTYWTQDSGRDVTVSMEQAFIQWGGLTAGRTDTFFQFYTGNTYDSLFDPAFIDMQTNVLAYKATLGNGVSAAISIEDGTTPRQAIRPVNPAFTNAYGGHWWPDLVGHIRLEQSWGSAQIMAALHDVRDGVGPVDNSELGWAIGAGAKIGLPMIAKGDWLGLQLVYADGAIRYAGQMQTFAFDGTRRPSGAIVTTTAFGVSGGITHFWMPTVSSSATVGYLDIDNFARARDDVQWDLQADIVWFPADGFQVGAEVEYRYVDYRVPQRGQSDWDGIVGLLRLERTF